jgi:cytochrome c-type biogenesis protein CcmH
MIRTVLLAIAFVLAIGLARAFAVTPDEVMADPALEARARSISAGLRCMVCQNQSIDDSDAELAKDLRVLVRERLSAGDTDAQVIDYVVSRYGEFVLLKPRFGATTLFLWLAPALMLVAGIAYLVFGARRNAPVTPAGAALSEAEKAELEKLLAKTGAD